MHIKEHLSYSQYSCYLSGEKNYIDRYIKGIGFSNKYTEFGKKTHERLELDKSEDEETELKLTCDFYKIPLFGYIDKYNKKIIQVIDYKTGKRPWNQKQVDENEQLMFYAILISYNYKIPINEIKLTLRWIETFEDIDGSINLTGREKDFHTSRTKFDEINIYPKIKKAWVGIDELINRLMK